MAARPADHRAPPPHASCAGTRAPRATCPGGARATRTPSGSARSCCSRRRWPRSSPTTRRFLKRFPTLRGARGGPLHEVLQPGRAWVTTRGRATCIARRARMAPLPVAVWPITAEAWQRVPGVGRYTASAIASIAFGEVVAGVGRECAPRARAARMITPAMCARRGASGRCGAGEALVPARDPGGFNQALMELGATVCLARNPACALCPLRLECLARRRGTVQARPQKRPAHRLPHYQVTAAHPAARPGPD